MKKLFGLAMVIMRLVGNFDVDLRRAGLQQQRLVLSKATPNEFKELLSYFTTSKEI